MRALLISLAIAFCPAAVPAETPEFSLYLGLWPEGGPEDEPVAGQAADTGPEGLSIYVTDAKGPVLDLMAPLSATALEALRSAITAMVARVNTDDQADIPRPSISVEWSISGRNNFARGNAVLPADALPPEVIRAQEVLFGGPLAP
ncbi:MAG: hypothetical protein ACK4RN_06885 [Pseudorhodobacter sp.]